MRRARSAVVVGAVALVWVGLLPAQAGAAPGASPGVAAASSPAPGDQYASPGTDITLRGVDESQAAAITVTGATSGKHPGVLSGLSTEVGVSFDPATDLQAGEQVTVTVPGVSVQGGNGDSFTFTVMTPAAPLSAEQSAAISAEDATATTSPDAAAAAAPGCTPTTVTPVSRPDLGTIPGICTTGSAKSAATDKIFTTSGNGQAIYNASTGQPVWFHSAPGSIIANFQSFTLGREQVFAYYEGAPFAVPGSGAGVYRILDSNYNLIHTVKAGNGYQADLHELQLTDKGTALIGIYQPIIANTSSVGGPPATIIVDYVVQEVELDTGNVKFEWHSIDHIKVSDSHQPQAGYEPWDWIHGNSIQKTSDGNYLVSGRHTWATYKIDGQTGALMWTLGGRSSNFGALTAGSDVAASEAKPFCWQHDFRELADGSFTMFDNASAVGLPNDNCGLGGPPAQSRGLVLNLVPPVGSGTGTATVTKVYRHSPEIPSGFAGDMQTRADGSRFVGFGGVPQSTLFAADGSSQLEVAQTALSYRAFLQKWDATPSEPPAAVVQNGSVYASWNGATTVAAWQVLAGLDAASLVPVGGVQPATGFETRLSLGGAPSNSVVRVQALDASGKVIGASASPLSGTTFLKRLNAGTTVGPGQLTSTSATEGSVTLPDLKVLFFAGGFLPAGVTLGVEPVSPTPSGAIPASTSYSSTGSTISFRANLRLKDISLLGFSLAGYTGASCATADPTEVTLSSPGDARVGSPLTASYTIAPFANCQGQEQTVSSLLSGPGNSLSARLR